MNDERLRIYPPDDLQDIIARNSGIILLHFHFNSFQPCEMVRRELEALAQDFQSRLEMAEVVIPFQSELVRDFEVTSIPTLLLFHGPEEVERVEHFWEPAILGDFLETALSFYN